jgi:glycosyltransferase involved in cell wall biosynthesis
MTWRKTRVLHLITRLELGGAQQNTLYCTANHDRGLFDVELIAGTGGDLDDEAREVTDATVQLVPWLRHEIDPWHDVEALFRLRSYMAERQIDVVHTHSSKAGILGRIAAHLAGVPLVVHTVHGWSFNDTQSRMRRRAYVALERLAAGFTDRIVVVSSKNREKGLSLGIGRPDRYEVVHSGIDVDGFRQPATDRASVRRSLGYEPDHVVVGTVACLKPQKAPIDFVRAAAEAYSRDDRLRFFIAGDGPLRPAVEAEIARLGLGGVVQLLGWRRDVVDLFHAMDLFLLTSLFEGLPRSVLQAMAARVPVVATDVDGTPEVVRNQRTGLLIPPARPDVASRALLDLIGDAELRNRCIDRADALLTREFEIRQMVRRLDRLYLEGLEDQLPLGGVAGDGRATRQCSSMSSS